MSSVCAPLPLLSPASVITIPKLSPKYPKTIAYPPTYQSRKHTEQSEPQRRRSKKTWPERSGFGEAEWQSRSWNIKSYPNTTACLCLLLPLCHLCCTSLAQPCGNVLYICMANIYERRKLLLLVRSKLQARSSELLGGDNVPG